MWRTNVRKDKLIYSAKLTELVKAKGVSGSFVDLPVGFEAPLDTFDVRTIALADNVFIAALCRDVSQMMDLPNGAVEIQITIE